MYRIGRDPESDIVVDDSRVSWQHAVLRFDPAEQNAWILQDTGSTNGTFMASQRVSQVTISNDCVLRLGHPDDGPTVECSLAAPARPDLPPPDSPPAARPATAVSPSPVSPPAASAPAAAPPAAPPPAAGYAGARMPSTGLSYAGSLSNRQPSAVMRLPSKVLRIGRAADNDVVVSDLSVSRYHAELRRARGGFEIVDLDSHNGTFLNGQRITAAPVTEMDLIGIGAATFRLVGEELQEFIDTGDISLTARDLTVRLPSGKVLLDHVSFPLGERCLLGVIGPSGAGKSTLLGALTGMRPATEGSVLYDGRDLYTHYAELRHRIGLVPQENILHTQLSARRALGYAAELRFPRDTSKAERQRRIDEVLGELSLTAARGHPDLRAVRRPAETRQRRARAADQALAAVPGRAHVRPGSRAGQVGHGADGRPGPRRPHGHRGHAQRRQPEPLRPPAGSGARRQDRLLRAARGRAPALRQARLGRGIPGLRRRAGPGLGRRVPGLAVLPPLRRGRR